jgi:hypothetical protein
VKALLVIIHSPACYFGLSSKASRGNEEERSATERVSKKPIERECGENGGGEFFCTVPLAVAAAGRRPKNKVSGLFYHLGPFRECGRRDNSIFEETHRRF